MRLPNQPSCSRTRTPSGHLRRMAVIASTSNPIGKRGRSSVRQHVLPSCVLFSRLFPTGIAAEFPQHPNARLHALAVVARQLHQGVRVLAEKVLQGPVNRGLAQRLARAIEETE